MGRGIKIALPSYNALTDTNPDHFALYVDQVTDYVLIKEKERGSGSVANSGTVTVAHNLGYIPFVLVYYEEASGKWRQVRGDDEWNGINFFIQVNTTNLLIKNFSGSTKNYKYYVFYDKLTGTSTNVLNESSHGLKIAKIGKNALTATDPLDYIFHSDLNTFKIIAEGNYTSTITDATYDQVYTVAHGQSHTPLVHGFVKFASYAHVLPPNGEEYSPIGSEPYVVRFNYIEADATNIRFSLSNNNSGATRTFTLHYYIFEVPLA